jgi:hypothetical protein
MPHGSLGAKKTEEAEECKEIFLLKGGSAETEMSESFDNW